MFQLCFHTSIRHRGGCDAAKRGEPAKALQMIHSGDQRLIAALRQPGERPAIRVFTHIKTRINQRNDIVHQLVISRFRI